MTDSKIAEPFELPCGLKFPNRLVKASMAEYMAMGDHLPSERMLASYKKWAEGGWGAMLTGNVQVDVRHLGHNGDLCFDDGIEYAKTLEAWKSWARTCNAEGTPTIVQINHPGRQSPMGAGTRGVFGKTVAPSAVPLHFGDSYIQKAIVALVFGTPQELSREDIQDVIRRFVNTARLSHEAGFAGVEIHAAHGYLLAQFMSPRSNKRTDDYGGSSIARVKIVVDIIRAIREAVPKDFCVALKLNSADHQAPEELEGWLEGVKEIAKAGVDFLEISGGTYENPTMSNGTASETASETKKATSTSAREAFFLDFAKSIRKILPDVPLMVTGGFRTRAGMEAAIEDGSCDLIGMARPAALNPAFPKEVLLNPDVERRDAAMSVYRLPPGRLASCLGLKKILGAGAETSWYATRIQELGDR